MATINLIDSFLQLMPVRWLLLAVAVVSLVVLAVSVVRQKALGIELELAKAANSEYRAAASVAEVKRKELEAKVAAASAEVLTIKVSYDARLEKLNKQKITSTTCAEMVAESVRLLQDEGDAD